MSNIAISQCCSYAACLGANCACSNLQLLCARHLNATHTGTHRGRQRHTLSHTHTHAANLMKFLWHNQCALVCVCVCTESLYYALALGILALALTNGDLQLRVQHLSSDAKRATPPTPRTHTHTNIRTVATYEPYRAVPHNELER